jgi:hypothetical protein
MLIYTIEFDRFAPVRDTETENPDVLEMVERDISLNIRKILLVRLKTVNKPVRARELCKMKERLANISTDIEHDIAFSNKGIKPVTLFFVKIPKYIPLHQAANVKLVIYAVTRHTADRAERVEMRARDKSRPKSAVFDASKYAKERALKGQLRSESPHGVEYPDL